MSTFEELSKRLFQQQQALYDSQLKERNNEALAPPRTQLLQEAINITAGDRNVAYGNPEDNFQNIADYWNAYLTQARKAATMLNSRNLTAQDVAHMMILMKMARLATNPQHRDSLVYIAGYAACGEDCRVRAATASSDTCEQAPRTA